MCNRVSLKAFDIGGIMSTPASDVHSTENNLRSDFKKIARDTTNNQ